MAIPNGDCRLASSIRSKRCTLCGSPHGPDSCTNPRGHIVFCGPPCRQATATRRESFYCGFQGTTDYKIRGITYSVRYVADPHGTWNDGVWESDILPTVGTVVSRQYYVRQGCCYDFPPEDILTIFPGFVGARWNSALGRIEYQGDPPETFVDRFGNVRPTAAMPELEYYYPECLPAA